MNIIKLNIYQTFHFNIIKLSRRISTFSKPLIICLLDKRENIEFWSNTYFLIPIVLYFLSSLPCPDTLLVCTTLLARRYKIVDYCQTEDLGAGLIIKRKKEERRNKDYYLVAIKKPRTVHSAPIPSSWKRIIYLMLSRSKDRQYILLQFSPELIVQSLWELFKLLSWSRPWEPFLWWHPPPVW